MTCPYCESPIDRDEARCRRDVVDRTGFDPDRDVDERERRRDHARWFARHSTREDRESLQGFARLMSDLDKDIEQDVVDQAEFDTDQDAAEAERGDE